MKAVVICTKQLIETFKREGYSQKLKLIFIDEKEQMGNNIIKLIYSKYKFELK